MSQEGPTIKALQDQLALLKIKYEEAVTSCCHLKNQYDGAREHLQKREDSLQQRLNTEEDWQKTKASLNRQSSEDKWCKEVSQLKELLKQNDQEVQRLTKKRQMRTKAFCDILYLLTVKERWTPEEQPQMSESGGEAADDIKRKRNLKELFKKQLVESEIKDKKALYDLNDQGGQGSAGDGQTKWAGGDSPEEGRGVRGQEVPSTVTNDLVLDQFYF